MALKIDPPPEKKADEANQGQEAIKDSDPTPDEETSRWHCVPFEPASR
jgi:hypothetical protein